MLQIHKAKQIFDTNIISSVATTQNLNEAFDAVYKNRKKYHHNNDIWHLSKNWNTERKQIQSDILSNSYNLEPVKVRRYKRRCLSMWTQKIMLSCG